MNQRRRTVAPAGAPRSAPQRSMGWSRGEGQRAAAERELDALYAALPTLACRGLCQDSCSQHVEASDLEHTRARTAGVDLSAPTPSGACPALASTFGAGHCTIHAVRPMVCRLWGIAASMPCPHGCLPDLTTAGAHHDGDIRGLGGISDVDAAGGQLPAAGRHMPDVVALRQMIAVLRLGGHDAAAPGVAELVDVCASDEIAAGLMARLLRGDTSVKPALGSRLQHLQRPQPSQARSARPRTPAAAPTSSAQTVPADGLSLNPPRRRG